MSGRGQRVGVCACLWALRTRGCLRPPGPPLLDGPLTVAPPSRSLFCPRPLDKTNWCSYIKRENVKCKKANVRLLPITGTIFLTGKQERRDPKARRLWAGRKALIYRGGCAGNCPPRRSSGTGCWTDCTSQLSPEQLYSYPQTLCTHQAGWPAGRRERRAGVGWGRED